MAASMEAIKNREIRGCIMRALAKTPFRAISSRALSSALIQVSTDLRPQLSYLADKGYITLVDFDEDKTNGVELLVNLTAKGVDLIDESIGPDPGITL